MFSGAPAAQVRNMFASISERYDLLNGVLSGGIHVLWRRKLFSCLPSIPEGKALDLCTGTGALLPGLTRKYKDVTGADFCEEMLSKAQGKTTAKIVCADALALPFSANSFDVVTVAFGVRNFENLDRGLQEIFRVLRHDGTVAILEFGQPTNATWKKVFEWYSKNVMPRIGGWISGNKDAYSYLPETSKRFPCGNEFAAILEKNGFENVKTQSLTGGIAWIYTSTKGAL